MNTCCGLIGTGLAPVCVGIMVNKSAWGLPSWQWTGRVVIEHISVQKAAKEKWYRALS